MRNVIFGGIGVLWGGSILLSSMLNKEPFESGAYGVGQRLGLLTAFLLFSVGLVYLIMGIRSLSQNKPKQKRRRRKKRWPTDRDE